jgi:hypothetical protein
MFTFFLSSESELFASNLNFKLCDDSFKGRSQCDPSNNNDLAAVVLSQRMGTIKNNYLAKYKYIKEELFMADNEVDVNLAVALYLATYYSAENESSNQYRALYPDDLNLLEFH